jgi:hypothetical protein
MHGAVLLAGHGRLPLVANLQRISILRKILCAKRAEDYLYIAEYQQLSDQR